MNVKYQARGADSMGCAPGYFRDLVHSGQYPHLRRKLDCLVYAWGHYGTKKSEISTQAIRHSLSTCRLKDQRQIKLRPIQIREKGPFSEGLGEEKYGTGELEQEKHRIRQPNPFIVRGGQVFSP